MKTTRSILAIAALAIAAPLFADTYTIDKAHSEALFSVRHLISRVSGKFDDIDATVNLDAKNIPASSVEFKMKTTSINTGVANRDNHLRSGDFFEAEKNPEITFKSTAIKATSKKDVFEVTGDLTIRGVTRSITLPVSFLGYVKDPWGKDKAGFSTSTTINRKDFGVNWNKSLDSGGFLVGDDVDITVNIEAYKVEPKPAAPSGGK